MGLVINGKKVIGLALNGKKILGEAKNGKVIWRFSIDIKPWKFTAGSRVNSVAVDSSGNVYAGTTGSSVYKLNTSGTQVWKFTADSYVNSVAVDSSGNVYAGTYGPSVYKLGASENQVWQFNADGNVEGVAVDSSGDVYVGTDKSSVYKLTPDGSNTTTSNSSAKDASITVGESLYDGIPSNGIMLYGDATGYSSSNPLGIQGNSINLKAPLSSCPNGIRIHFSTISYFPDGSLEYGGCSIPDISIPKGSSSGSSTVYSNLRSNGDSNITASIRESALSFSFNQNGKSIKGTITSMSDDNYGHLSPSELLAITSITAY